MASTQFIQQRYDVIFFERNGLRHGEFTLRGKIDKVLDLRWNSDSDILAVLVRLQDKVLPSSLNVSLMR